MAIPGRAVILTATVTTGALNMKTSPLFEPSQTEIDALLTNYPLALVISLSPEGIVATPLPLLLERDARGVAVLVGHFARANPQVAAIRENAEALVVFQGPHGYISPSWFTDRTQAPTWNFATVQFKVRIRLETTEESAANAVDSLSEAMESGRPNAWHPRELGARYSKLIRHVVAFRADIVSTKAKFKLGQNERLDVLHEALGGIEQEGLRALAAAMRSANATRLNLVDHRSAEIKSHESQRETAAA